jgi:histone H3
VISVQKIERKQKGTMARTKSEPENGNKKLIKTMTGRLRESENAAVTAGVKATKPHRYRAGTRALIEIRQQQRGAELLMQKAPFRRLVRTIGDEQKDELMWTKEAMVALQTAAEAYLIEMFQGSNAMAIFSKRSTIMPRDILMALFMKGDSPYNAADLERMLAEADRKQEMVAPAHAVEQVDNQEEEEEEDLDDDDDEEEEEEEEEE